MKEWDMGAFIGRRSGMWIGLLVVVAALVLVSGAAGRTAARTDHRTALPTWLSVYAWPLGLGYSGWHSTTTAPDAYGLQTALGGRPGLWLWPFGGRRTYQASDYAEWTYTAPGTTRLENAHLSYTWSNRLLGDFCIDIGLRTGDGTVVTHREACKATSQSQQDLTLSDPQANPTSTVVYVRIHANCGVAPTCVKTISSLDPLKSGPYLRVLNTEMALVDDDNPTLTPAGPLYDLHDTYINGHGTYSITVHADDAGSGVVGASLVRQGFSAPTGTLSARFAPCDLTRRTPSLDARICPPTFEYQATIDSNTLAEGTSHFLEKALDVAGNVGTSAAWAVYVDRTPPSVPANISLVSFRAASGEASVAWDASTDPALPDGAAGSGVDHYNIQYQLNGGAWSDWVSAPDAAFVVPGGHAGDVLAVEVQSVDAVGNTSASASASFTLVDTEPDLTSDQAAAADASAVSDPQVTALIGGGPYSVTETDPWTTTSGQPLGAEVTITMGAPTTITADWPSPGVVARYTAANVTGLSVLVDTSCNQVVSIEPDEDAYATDTPTFVSEGSGACGLSTFEFNSTVKTAAAAATPGQWVHNVRPIHVGPDVFYNYDFTTPSLSGSIDWPIDLVFWNNALTPNQVKLFDYGASIADPAYLNIGQGHGPNFWDEDQGSKSGVPACNTVEHYRVYKDDTASSTRFTTNWGFYIVGSAHLDRFEECDVFDPFTGSLVPVGDHWSGRGERSESIIADKAATVWGPGAIQRNFVQLYNAETTHREGNHRFENDGKATKIKVCIDRLGQNTVCP
jgi:hypothetical protein